MTQVPLQNPPSRARSPKSMRSRSALSGPVRPNSSWAGRSTATEGEKQGPTLRRAGELFSELTLGSFEDLELDYDEQDRPRLVGRRPDGERVKVEGLSQGPVDQLYLALRISALEDYAERKQCLPFIADDLFINFDDLRAEAGLKILGRLAQRCQVIFFTHHDHLSDIAERALEGKAQVWRMAPLTGRHLAKPSKIAS